MSDVVIRQDLAFSVLISNSSPEFQVDPCKLNLQKVTKNRKQWCSTTKLLKTYLLKYIC